MLRSGSIISLRPKARGRLGTLPSRPIVALFIFNDRTFTRTVQLHRFQQEDHVLGLHDRRCGVAKGRVCRFPRSVVAQRRFLNSSSSGCPETWPVCSFLIYFKLNKRKLGNMGVLPTLWGKHFVDAVASSSGDPHQCLQNIQFEYSCSF